MGFPCCYHIRKRQLNPGVILLSDIDSLWHYDRDALVEQTDHQILLELAPIKGKGRLRGVKETRLVAKDGKLKKTGNNKGDGESSTRRDPSGFEYADYLPLSTIPPPPPQYHQNSQMSNSTCTGISHRCVSNSDITDNIEDLTTTALGLLRGAGGNKDLFEPATPDQRAY